MHTYNPTLKRLQPLTHVLFTSFILTLLGAAPVVADDFLAGQPYFSLSGMVVTADSATIASAAGTNHPSFKFPDPKFKTDTGWGVVGTFGWLTDTNWRGEFELGHRQVSLDQINSPAGAEMDGRLELTTVFVNVLRDFRGESFITPYAGIGVGGSYHKLNVTSLGGAPPDFGVRDDFLPMYQAMVGLNFEVGDDMDILMGYRFTGAIRPDYEAIKLERLDIHHFEMGIKFYIEDWFK